MENGHIKWSWEVRENARKMVVENHFQCSVGSLSSLFLTHTSSYIVHRLFNSACIKYILQLHFAVEVSSHSKPCQIGVELNMYMICTEIYVITNHFCIKPRIVESNLFDRKLFGIYCSSYKFANTSDHSSCGTLSHFVLLCNIMLLFRYCLRQGGYVIPDICWFVSRICLLYTSPSPRD